MNGSREREGFSDRLQQALRNAHYQPDSPTKLAREFNIRFSGRAVTVHAARKWLVGEAIPTQEKNCAPWRNGLVYLQTGCVSAPVPMRCKTMPRTMRMVRRVSPRTTSSCLPIFQLLDDHHRQIAREFIRMLLRVGRKK
ncbi:hypothetical protein ACFS07_32355 [Undibacterium arcticum]